MAEKSESEEGDPQRQILEQLDDDMRETAAKNRLKFVRARWVLLRRNKIAARLGEPQKTLDDFLVPAVRRRS